MTQELAEASITTCLLCQLSPLISFNSNHPNLHKSYYLHRRLNIVILIDL